jgi:hypothetical protein
MDCLFTPFLGPHYLDIAYKLDENNEKDKSLRQAT